MKKPCFVTLAIFLLAVNIYAQDSKILQLTIDGANNRVICTAKPMLNPGAQLDISFKQDKLPPAFELTAVAYALKGKKQSDTLKIKNGASKKDLRTDLFRGALNNGIVSIFPTTKDVTKIALTFRLGDKKLTVSEGPGKSESDSLILVAPSTTDKPVTAGATPGNEIISRGRTYQIIDDGKKGVLSLKVKEKPARVEINFNETLPADFKVLAGVRTKDKKTTNEIEVTNGSVSNTMMDIVRVDEKKGTTVTITPKKVQEVAVTFTMKGKALTVRDSITAKEDASLLIAFSPAAATGGTSSAALSMNPCEEVSPEIDYFIPPMEVMSLLGDETCTTCKNDYKVAYDLRSGEPKLCFYKKVECNCPSGTENKAQRKKEKCNCADGKKYCYEPVDKIHPWVGEKIGFHVYGYYSSFDSLGIDFAFESRNVELRDEFSAATSGKAPKKAEPSDTTKAGDEGENEAPATSTSEQQIRKDLILVERIRDEFARYYAFIINSSPSQEQVETDAAYINRKLNSYECIHLKTFSPAGLVAAVRELLDRIIDDRDEIENTKLRILQIAENAAIYYAYILNYSTMKIPVVQVANEDMLKYTMNFYKAGKKLHSRDYSMLIRGGWKIDFSTGVVFNTLMDEEYEIKYDTIALGDDGVDNDAVGQIVVKEKGKFTANVGIMSHIYTRSGKRTNGGFTFGFVFEDGTISKYIAGGSLMLGYEQRWVISGGLIGGAVDRLDSSYKDAFGKNVHRSRFSAISSAVPTTQQWDFGWFVSFSYNFGGTAIGK